ncbi:hypothetical protein [Microbacterium testaceum]|uniref:hypothetical protein n=1 Tax=Microbacterium testaceum TaxID=2033 RepID=UPI002AC7C8C1|nr:hypothetical protein [Microbacterium testaceum]MDZ5146373.1 hypothetical protein [Microbacterium testaceum]
MPAPIKLDLHKVADHTYIADQLHVSLRTVYQYAAGAQRAPGLPEPIALPGVRSALFKRVDADAFISSRRHNASDQKGRLRVDAIDTTALAASAKAAEILGREVDLEDLAQLRRILFQELSLPATRSTARGLSVATPDLVALQEAHPHPFLHQVLVYRGAIA